MIGWWWPGVYRWRRCCWRGAAGPLRPGRRTRREKKSEREEADGWTTHLSWRRAARVGPIAAKRKQNTKGTNEGTDAGPEKLCCSLRPFLFVKEPVASAWTRLGDREKAGEYERKQGPGSVGHAVGQGRPTESLPFGLSIQVQTDREETNSIELPST